MFGTMNRKERDWKKVEIDSGVGSDGWGKGGKEEVVMSRHEFVGVNGQSGAAVMAIGQPSTGTVDL